MAIEPVIGRRPNMVISSVERVANTTLGRNAISEEKKKIEGHWAAEHILLGFEVDIMKGSIALPREKQESAKRLIWMALCDPGSKIVLLKSLQELRGNYTHWQMANQMWGYFARPVGALLSQVDELNMWIRREKIEVWAAYWHSISWLRELSLQEEEWGKMFDGQLNRCLPSNLRLCGNLDQPPALRMSSDATLKRIGIINWRTREFVCSAIGSLFNPFMPDGEECVHISDVELIAIVMGIVIWSTDFDGTTLGIADNMNALQWLVSQRAQHGIALQLLRTTSRWIIVDGSDFSGLYARSHRNVSSDHLARLSYEEIQRWADMGGFKWIDPFAVNDNWVKFTKSAIIGNEWKSEDTTQQERVRAYWNPAYGVILDWDPGALDVAKLCEDREIPTWVSNPRHSIVDIRRRGLGINVWNENENVKTKMFYKLAWLKQNLKS